MPEPLRYEELREGERVGRGSFAVSEELARRYAAATWSAAPAGEAPPLLAALLASPRHVLGERPLPPGCVHARQWVRFLAPLRVGDVVETDCAVESLYERRGRRYVAFATTVTRAGEPVAETRMTLVWPQ